MCSQVILGMGANATAAPNTTARAVSGPPARAHILLRGGGASAAMPVGREAAARVPGHSQPRGPDPQHCLELTGIVTPEDPHFSARLGGQVALASANVTSLLFLNSGLLSDLPEKSGREQKGCSQAAGPWCLMSVLSVSHPPPAGSARCPGAKPSCRSQCFPP